MRNLFQNLDLKIWAMVIAVVLWFHVKTEKKYEESFQIPFEIPQPDEKLVQINPLPNTLTFLLKGTGKELIRMKWSSKMKASVKLPHVKKGKMNLSLSRDNVNIAPKRDVEIVFIDPPGFLLEFDQLVEKKVRVRAQVEGTPRNGFVWTGEVDLSPAMVNLRGGKSLIEVTDSLLTEKIELTNRNKDFIKNTSILLPPGEGFRIVPDSVTLTIPIVEFVERTYTDVPVRIENKPHRLNAILDRERGMVILGGPKNRMEEIQSGDLFITLDLKGKNKGKFELPPLFEPPSGITVISTGPEFFKVTLE